MKLLKFSFLNSCMLECFAAEIGPEYIVLNGKDCTDSFGRNSFVEGTSINIFLTEIPIVSV